MGVVIGVVKMFSRTPEKRFKWEALEEDAELGNGCFPMVLVQIPMYNEREVYKLSIGAACGLSWPSDRIIVQVLDDSTDPTIKEMVEMECQKWASNGIDIKYEIRGNRNGYKAGALSEGMKRSYVRECDYVVVFDADFQPEPDFLHRTIPFLVHNPNLALVQARWKFVNADECLMTRMQQMSLDFHFAVEQEVGSWAYAFFSFNVLPTTCLVPEVDVPKWGAIYIPFIVTLINSVGTPRSFHLLSFWILFENVMATHRAKGTFIGLLEVGRVNEWVVTEKLGEASKLKSTKETYRKPRSKIVERMYILELVIGAYLLFCGSYDLFLGKRQYCWYIILQSFAFFIAGFGYIGTYLPTS
nr:hypothetical protein BRARA_C00129 [Ipomoea trifida]